MCGLRLESFESQEALAALLAQSQEGLQACRKRMLAVDARHERARDEVQGILHTARAFVIEAYVKHSKTAGNLLASHKREMKAKQPKAKAGTESVQEAGVETGA